MPWTPLILDTFIFDEANLEVPERLTDLGGMQLISCHDYPGGIIEQKSYGYFPGEQKWSGKFHGADASDRMNAVKRILYTGNEVQLSFGPNAWLGRVVKFTPTARSQWLFEYELEFKPRLDISSGAPSLPTTGNLGTVLALHILALQSIIKYGLDPSFVGQAAAIAIGGVAGAVLLQVQETIAASGGFSSQTAPLGQAAVFASTQQALVTLSPYQESANPAVSSPATDAAARISGIQNVYQSAAAPQTTIQTINPNLYVISAQYYGDASDWRTIATANGLNDPQPIGSYTLNIPPSPS
jgi:hypothetical protein